MTPACGNLYRDLAPDAAGERFDQLVAQQGVTIERIVSTGQASPDGFWYDDPRAEWVVLLAGFLPRQFVNIALEFQGIPAS